MLVMALLHIFPDRPPVISVGNDGDSGTAGILLGLLGLFLLFGRHRRLFLDFFVALLDLAHDGSPEWLGGVHVHKKWRHQIRWLLPGQTRRGLLSMIDDPNG